MFDRIAFVKAGWSDKYQGGPVVGRFAHIAKFDEAHERFNFMRCGRNYYGYSPPIGKEESAPQPKAKTGWLLIFVAARNGTGPLTVVGWYLNATIHTEYLDRLEYAAGEFELDVHGANYSYCYSSPKAVLMPVGMREWTISGKHFGRAPILYARGNGRNDLWRRSLARLAERIVGSYKKGTAKPPPRLAFPDAEHRKKVELAAVNKAKAHLKKLWLVKDRQKDRCGYDLLATHRKTGKQLHIEVKGTSGATMHFYMTWGEYLQMKNPKWKLFIITNALSKQRRLSILTESEVTKRFEFAPYAWEATLKP